MTAAEPAPPPELRAAEDLLVEHAARDFEDGLAHSRERLRAQHGRLAGGALDAIVTSAVNVLHLREQMREDVRFIVRLAQRVAAGEDPERIAADNLERVLRLRQKMHFLVRTEDVAFQKVLAMARETFAKRLPDLARMASVRDPRDYDDLVRQAFPDRAYVEAMVRDNRDFTIALVDHLERHPHVLRVPTGLVPKIAATAREVVEWQTEKVLRGIEEIYAQATT